MKGDNSCRQEIYKKKKKKKKKRVGGGGGGGREGATRKGKNLLIEGANMFL